MGEETELILNGTLCKLCGYLIEDLIPKEGKLLKTLPGYQWICRECKTAIERNIKIPFKIACKLKGTNKNIYLDYNR